MNSFENNIFTEKIGDGIKLYVEGIPPSIRTPATQTAATLALLAFLMQDGISMGASFTAGIIGSTGNATLKIGKSYYKIKYAFCAMRAMTALEIYSQAIEYRKLRGQTDKD